MTGEKALLIALLAGGILWGCVATSPSMQNVKTGYAYLMKKDYAQAESHFSKALELDPKNPYALLNLGVVYQNTGRTSLARDMYLEVIRLSPKEVPGKVTDGRSHGMSLVMIASENLQSLQE